MTVLSLKQYHDYCNELIFFSHNEKNVYTYKKKLEFFQNAHVEWTGLKAFEVALTQQNTPLLKKILDFLNQYDDTDNYLTAHYRGNLPIVLVLKSHAYHSLKLLLSFIHPKFYLNKRNIELVLLTAIEFSCPLPLLKQLYLKLSSNIFIDSHELTEIHVSVLKHICKIGSLSQYQLFLPGALSEFQKIEFWQTLCLSSIRYDNEDLFKKNYHHIKVLFKISDTSNLLFFFLNALNLCAQNGFENGFFELLTDAQIFFKETFSSKELRTLLSSASQGGSTAIVEKIFEQAPHLKLDEQSKNPLYAALERSHCDLLYFFLKHKKDFFSKLSFTDLFDKFCQRLDGLKHESQVQTLKYLIDYYSSKEDISPFLDSDNFLKKIISLGNFELFTYALTLRKTSLKATGSSSSFLDDKKTLLHYAAESHNANIIEYLLKIDFSPNTQDIYRQIPLDLALENKNSKKSITLLCEKLSFFEIRQSLITSFQKTTPDINKVFLLISLVESPKYKKELYEISFFHYSKILDRSFIWVEYFIPMTLNYLNEKAILGKSLFEFKDFIFSAIEKNDIFLIDSFLACVINLDKKNKVNFLKECLQHSLKHDFCALFSFLKVCDSFDSVEIIQNFLEDRSSKSPLTKKNYLDLIEILDEVSREKKSDEQNGFKCFDNEILISITKFLDINWDLKSNLTEEIAIDILKKLSLFYQSKPTDESNSYIIYKDYALIFLTYLEKTLFSKDYFENLIIIPLLLAEEIRFHPSSYYASFFYRVYQLSPFLREEALYKFLKAFLRSDHHEKFQFLDILFSNSDLTSMEYEEQKLLSSLCEKTIYISLKYHLEEIRDLIFFIDIPKKSYLLNKESALDHAFYYAFLQKDTNFLKKLFAYYSQDLPLKLSTLKNKCFSEKIFITEALSDNYFSLFFLISSFLDLKISADKPFIQKILPLQEKIFTNLKNFVAPNSLQSLCEEEQKCPISQELITKLISCNKLLAYIPSSGSKTFFEASYLIQWISRTNKDPFTHQSAGLEDIQLIHPQAFQYCLNKEIQSQEFTELASANTQSLSFIRNLPSLFQSEPARKYLDKEASKNTHSR